MQQDNCEREDVRGADHFYQGGMKMKINETAEANNQEVVKKEGFWKRNWKKVLIGFGIALGVGVGTYGTYKYLVAPWDPIPIPEIEPEPEKYYYGVPMSALNDLAKTVYHGKRVYEDGGYLILEYTSNSNRTTFRPQLRPDENGQLINLGGHYPGQAWTSADKFAERANQNFRFEPCDVTPYGSNESA